MSTPAADFDPYRKWLAISDPRRPVNHYRLLGLELFENDLEVVQNASDARMALVRTFASGKHSTLSQKILNELAAAKVCLLNPTKRAAYDAKLRAEQAAEEQASAPPATPSGAAPAAPLAKALPVAHPVPVAQALPSVPPPLVPRAPSAFPPARTLEQGDVDDDSEEIPVEEAEELLRQAAAMEAAQLQQQQQPPTAAPIAIATGWKPPTGWSAPVDAVEPSSRSSLRSAPRGAAADNTYLLAGGAALGVLCLALVWFATSGGRETPRHVVKGPEPRPQNGLGSLVGSHAGGASSHATTHRSSTEGTAGHDSGHETQGEHADSGPTADPAGIHWPEKPRGRPTAASPESVQDYHAEAGLLAAQFLDAQNFAAVDWEGRVYQGESETGEMEVRFRIPDGPLSAALILPGKRQVVAATAGKRIVVYNLSDGAEAVSCERVGKLVRRMAAPVGGEYLSVIDTDGVPSVYRLSRGRLLERFSKTTEPIRWIQYYPGDWSRLLVVSPGRLQVWNAFRSASAGTWTDRRPDWTLGAAVDEGRELVAVDAHGRAAAWNASSSSSRARDWNLGGGPYSTLTPHLHGPWVAVAGGGSFDKGETHYVAPPGIFVVDALERKIVAEFHGHMDVVSDLSFAPTGKRLLSASLDGTARIWKLPDALHKSASPGSTPVAAEGDRLTGRLEFFSPAALFPGPSASELPLAATTEKRPKKPADKEPAPRNVPENAKDWLEKHPPLHPAPLADSGDVETYLSDYAPRLDDGGKALGRDEQLQLAKTWLADAQRLHDSEPGLARYLLVRAFVLSSEGARGDGDAAFSILQEFEKQAESVPPELHLAVRTARSAMLRELLLLFRRQNQSAMTARMSGLLVDAEHSRVEALCAAGLFEDAKKALASPDFVELVRGFPTGERADQQKRLKGAVDWALASRAKLQTLLGDLAKSPSPAASEKLGLFLLTQTENPRAAAEHLSKSEAEGWKQLGELLAKADEDPAVYREAAKKALALSSELKVPREQAGLVSVFLETLKELARGAQGTKLPAELKRDAEPLSAAWEKLPAPARDEVYGWLRPSLHGGK